MQAGRTIWFHSQCGSTLRALILPAFVLVSSVLHLGIAKWQGWKSVAVDVSKCVPDDTFEVTVIKEIAPEPQPEPEIPEVEEAEPPPEELPEELVEIPPEIPEIIETPVPPEEPAPIPVSKPTPRPKPASTPTKKSSPVAAAPSKPSSQPKPRVTEARPNVARNAAPHYPESARRNGLEGRVFIRAQVNASGRVERVSIHRSSGHASLDQAALRAVRRWRFIPRMVNGEPAVASVEVPVNFYLQ